MRIDHRMFIASGRQKFNLEGMKEFARKRSVSQWETLYKKLYNFSRRMMDFGVFLAQVWASCINFTAQVTPRRWGARGGPLPRPIPGLYHQGELPIGLAGLGLYTGRTPGLGSFSPNFSSVKLDYSSKLGFTIKSFARSNSGFAC